MEVATAPAQHDLQGLLARRLRLDLISGSACIVAIAAGIGMGLLHEGPLFIACTVLLIVMSYLSTYYIDVSHLINRKIHDVEYFHKHGHAPPKEEDTASHDRI